MALIKNIEDPQTGLLLAYHRIGAVERHFGGPVRFAIWSYASAEARMAGKSPMFLWPVVEVAAADLDTAEVPTREQLYPMAQTIIADLTDAGQS